MKMSLTQREYLDWQKYWEDEPWGPYRDNLHSALIAREVQRPQLRKGMKSKLDDFMITNPEKRRRAATGSFIDFLKLVATPKVKAP